MVDTILDEYGNGYDWGIEYTLAKDENEDTTEELDFDE